MLRRWDGHNVRARGDRTEICIEVARNAQVHRRIRPEDQGDMILPRTGRKHAHVDIPCGKGWGGWGVYNSGDKEQYGRGQSQPLKRNTPFRIIHSQHQPAL